MHINRIAPFLMILLLIAGPASAQMMTGDLSKANKLFAKGEEEKALDKYLEVLDISPTNYEALCQVSLLYARIGNRKDDDDTKKEYFNNAKDYAKRALNVDSNDAESNYVMSVAMGRMALIVGPRARVKASKDIRKYAQRALKYEPKHAGAWYVMGRWHYKVANLNFAERSAANLLFGGTPAGASNQKAIECFEKAVKYRPDYMLNPFELAETHRKLGNYDKAKTYYKKVVEMEPETPDDPGMQKEARDHLEDL